MLDLVRRLALVAAVPVALLGLAVAPAHATSGGPADAPAGRVTPTATQILAEEVTALTNERRMLAGCDTLTVEYELLVASVRQSHYMAATGDFSHFGWRGSTLLARSRAAGYQDVAGENIAWGFSTAAEVVDAWMASPEHRANIMNCGARAIGVGVQRSANGTYYWTQVFGWV